MERWQWNIILHGGDDGEPLEEAGERRIELESCREVHAQVGEGVAEGVPILVQRHGGSAGLRHVQGEGSRVHHCDRGGWRGGTGGRARESEVECKMRGRRRGRKEKREGDGDGLAGGGHLVASWRAEGLSLLGALL